MSVSSDEEDLDCPLCMEEIDITDRYFKPCPCGYQVCRFCWNHIKENLNSLCPACRRPYSEDTVEFTPVPPEEIARIKALKKRKERERKEQDQVSRRNLANARVVQKNLVYVLGLPPKFATEEVLRTPEYFGQYGNILRVVVNRRAHGHTPVLAQVPNTGVYITFTKKEDAARSIEAVDGSVYDGKIIRATYGTTKYCSYFLKNQTCQNPACQFLHEPGEEPDSFARDELSRMQARERNPKPPPFPITTDSKKDDKDQSALPATASWAKPVARPVANQFTSNGSPLMSSPMSGTPTSPRSEAGEHTMPIVGRIKPAQPVAARATVAVEEPVTEVLSGLLSGQTAPEPPSPEVEEVMGSSALDEYHTHPDLANSKGSSPKLTVVGAEEVRQLLLPEDVDDSFSLTALGFVLHPKYIGPFDPFRIDPLQIFPGLGVISEEDARYAVSIMRSIPPTDANDTVRSSSRASDSGQRSRFERFFGGPPGVEGPAFDPALVTEKKEDVETVQESFRAMFPNVNVSFASGSLSDAEARWGESFSPSKLAVSDAGSDTWPQGQNYANQPPSQPRQGPFPSGSLPRGPAAPTSYSNQRQQEHLLQQQRQQQQHQQQQQYGSPLPPSAQVQPHLANQFSQQLRLAHMQQQPGLHLPGGMHTHGQQPQEELIGHILRDAQFRQELQLRAASGTAGAPGFEGRVRPLQPQPYQQDWLAPALSSGYGANGNGGEEGNRGEEGEKQQDRKATATAVANRKGSGEEHSQYADRSQTASKLRKVATSTAYELESRKSTNVAQDDVEDLKESGSATESTSRPQTPVLSNAAFPPIAGSPTPRRVLTITSSKKPEQQPAPPPVIEEVKPVIAQRVRGKRGKVVAVAPQSESAELRTVPVAPKAVKVENIVEKVAAVIEPTPESSPLVSKRRSKNKVQDAEKKAPLALWPTKEPLEFPSLIKDSEVEAIVSRKTKKRKERKAPPPRPPVVVEQSSREKAIEESAAAIIGGFKQRLENLGVDVEGLCTPYEQPIPASPTETLPPPTAPVLRPVPDTQPLVQAPVQPAAPPPVPPVKETRPRKHSSAGSRRSDQKKSQRNGSARNYTTAEVDITSLFTGVNANYYGEMDMHVDMEAFKAAIGQLTAGYAGGVDLGTANVNVRIDVQQQPHPSNRTGRLSTSARQGQASGPTTHGPAPPPTSTSLNESVLSTDHLYQLSTSLRQLSQATNPDQRAPDGPVNINVNGVAMTIDTNTFIDQALEGLATTAAFLYEGLEAQAEKVRIEEELRGKRSNSKEGQPEMSDQTKGNIQRVADQVTKLEEYAAKLQARVSQGGLGLGWLGETPEQAAASEMDGQGSPKKRKGKGGQAVDPRQTSVPSDGGTQTRPSRARSTTSGSGKQPPASESVSVTSDDSANESSGSVPGTASWTTEDWKAKCRSVEVVMKRVREARDLRRQQKDGVRTAAVAAGEAPTSLADVLNMSILGAVAGGQVHPLDDSEMIAAAEQHQENCTSCMHAQGGSDVDPRGADQPGLSPASSVPAESGSAQNLFESNHIQRLLETVRLLVSSGEMLASTPSPAATLDDPANMDQGRKKRRKGSAVAARPQHGLYVGSEEGVQHLSTAQSSQQPLGGPSGTTTAETTRETVIFNPAPLLAAVASGVIAPGMPIPWEMFGLRGLPAAPQLDGHQQAHRNPADEAAAMDVQILERELEMSKREERALERQLVQVVRRNRLWQNDVADALDLDLSADEDDPGEQGHQHDDYPHGDDHQHHHEHTDECYDVDQFTEDEDGDDEDDEEDDDDDMYEDEDSHGDDEGRYPPPSSNEGAIFYIDVDIPVHQEPHRHPPPPSPTCSLD
ncbi:transcriptional repressor general negative regulator of transcription subunit 4 [Thoreauomyces humboldtii]|nr:transcriptional repressor general negative regulator of transcription subunit 4 [Thoreauomyces humboldtii]